MNRPRTQLYWRDENVMENCMEVDMFVSWSMAYFKYIEMYKEVNHSLVKAFLQLELWILQFPGIPELLALRMGELQNTM